MAPEPQLIRVVRGQDLSLRFTMDATQSVSGWTVGFTAKPKSSLATVLSKTTSSGITLTDTTRGVITVTIAAADTSSLELTENLSEGDTYLWDLARTDSGSKTVLARGELELVRDVT